jgi:hypothetical protein
MLSLLVYPGQRLSDTARLADPNLGGCRSESLRTMSELPEPSRASALGIRHRGGLVSVRSEFSLETGLFGTAYRATECRPAPRPTKTDEKTPNMTLISRYWALLALVMTPLKAVK